MRWIHRWVHRVRFCSRTGRPGCPPVTGPDRVFLKEDPPDTTTDWAFEGGPISPGEVSHQLVLNMSSEDDMIFIDFSEYVGQEDTNCENSDQRVNDCVQTSLDRCTCVHTNFDQQNHTTSSLVRSYDNNPVIRSQKHWYVTSALGCHPFTICFHVRESRHEISCTHMKHTTIHRQNHFDGLLHVSVQLHLHVLSWYMTDLVVLERTMSVY